MKRPKMIIVGADKGGTGKTTITRVLSDYMQAKSVACRFFDTEFPAGDLNRFISAEIIDISKVTSQMRVFDSIDENVVSVIDLRAGMLSPILLELDNAKLLEDVRQNKIDLVLLHILSSTISSLEEIVTAAKRIGGGAKHYLVKNYINDSTFFEWDNDENSPFKRMQDLTLTIPQLTELACEQIQKQHCSFVSYAQDHGQSRILRGRVVQWLKHVFDEFDRINIAGRENA